MEIVIFVGAQAAGKSTFYQNRFFDSHVRVNLDMLRTRRRERFLTEACLQIGQPLVIDNTNPTREQRARYFDWIATLAPDDPVRGFYFQSRARDCIARNRSRSRSRQVPDKAIRGTINRLELPSINEGFSQLSYVRIEEQAFIVEEWNDEF